MKRNENFGRSDDPPIKLIHKGVYKETKICSTCNIVKPFRSHHCNDCGNCINGFDHHCPWIGGCVGGRNYIYFFTFICLLNIKNIFIAIFCIIHIIYIYKDVKEEDKIENWVALNLIELIPTLLTITFIGFTMAFTVGLNIYHTNLIINNITTKEEIKKLIYVNIGNPYDKGCAKNCNEFWTKHKKYENNFTVKDLRAKAVISENDNLDKQKLIATKKKKPLIMPYGYSKKERELLNKPKNINSNANNYEQKKEIDNENNNMIEVESEVNKLNKGNKEKKEETSSKNKNNIEGDNKSKEEDDFSIGNISDENDNYKSKVCNTSVKNKSNLNKIDDLESSQTGKKNIFNDKNINFSKEDKGYLIAQKRLEELSSEITIHEELKNSMSIPNENSLNSSLSQS